MPPTLRPVSSDQATAADGTIESALAQVRDALGRLRYGGIQLVVHDGRLVQLEVTERQRFA